MEYKEIQLRYGQVGHYSELNPDDKSLFEKAIAAMRKAYAPYSKFKVGAAVLLADGTIVIGSNQENIAYPSGLCAERVALFASGAMHPGIAVKTIAVVADPLDAGATVSPCGSCRQVVMEYQRLHNSPVRMLTGALQGPVTVIENANFLLPLAFFDAGLTNPAND